MLLVNEHIFPRPTFKISFSSYEIHEKKLYVIRIDVAESPIKPIIVKFKNVPSIYMRREGFTNGSTYEEIIYMSIKSRKTQFDILDSDYTYKRENFTKLFSFFNEHNSGNVLTDKALQSEDFRTICKKRFFNYKKRRQCKCV